MKGWWATSTSFVALVDEYAIFTYYHVTMTFLGDRVTLTLWDLACPGGGSITLHGTMQR